MRLTERSWRLSAKHRLSNFAIFPGLCFVAPLNSILPGNGIADLSTAAYGRYERPGSAPSADQRRQTGCRRSRARLRNSVSRDEISGTKSLTAGQESNTHEPRPPDGDGTYASGDPKQAVSFVSVESPQRLCVQGGWRDRS